MYLITNAQVRVERVLGIRVRCQRAYEKGAVREGRLHAVLVVVVYYFDQSALLSADLLFSHPVDVVVQEVERLQRLHERGAGDVALGSGLPVPERQRPRERRSKTCFSVLPRQVDQRLVEADHLRACVIKSDQVIDDELLPGLQKERRAAQRLSGDRLALLVAERLLDDLDAELRAVVLQLVCRIVQVTEEPVDCLLPLFIRYDLPVPDAFRVLQDGCPFLVLHAPPIDFSASSSADPFSFFCIAASLIRFNPAGVSPRSRQYASAEAFRSFHRVISGLIT